MTLVVVICTIFTAHAESSSWSAGGMYLAHDPGPRKAASLHELDDGKKGGDEDDEAGGSQSRLSA